MTPDIKIECSDRIVELDSHYKRDRIVVIGRRSSGKTVYISMLYHKLWESNKNIKMKAVKGTSHAQFIKTAEAIREGKWPAATQGVAQSFIEIEHMEQNRMMVVLDYPGEVFTDAFIREAESKEVETLLDHIDHASGVILLIDPEHVTNGDVDSKMDNNYGLLQVINRIQNWPGGRSVPVVLALTKYDQTRPIIMQYGGARLFVEKYFSSLIQTTKHLKVCTMSVFTKIIQPDSSDTKGEDLTLEIPLLYCLERLKAIEAKEEDESRRKRIYKYNKILKKKEKRYLIISIIIWPVVITLAYGLLLWAVVHYLPFTVWSNLWYNIMGK